MFNLPGCRFIRFRVPGIGSILITKLQHPELSWHNNHPPTEKTCLHGRNSVQLMTCIVKPCGSWSLLGSSDPGGQNMMSDARCHRYHFFGIQHNPTYVESSITHYHIYIFFTSIMIHHSSSSSSSSTSSSSSSSSNIIHHSSWMVMVMVIEGFREQHPS